MTGSVCLNLVQLKICLYALLSNFCCDVAKEYLTAATYYCQVEVTLRDRIVAVDAIFRDQPNSRFHGRDIFCEIGLLP